MVPAEKQSINSDKTDLDGRKTKIQAGACLLGLSLLGGLAAGSYSARIAKKKSQQYYKDLNMKPKIMPETPTSLAFRALARATVYTVGFFSIVILATCKWYGINSLDDLRTKVRSYSRRNHKSEGRTEFESLSDFLQYIEETYSKPKEQKQEINEI